jgi:hypothetical protein
VDANEIHNRDLEVVSYLNAKAAPKQQWGMMGLIKILLLAVLLYFVGVAIIERVTSLEWDHLAFDFRFLSLAVLAAISARIFMGVLYGVLLILLNNPLPFTIAMVVGWVAMLGKYIPGKVASLAGTAYLLARYQVRPAISATITTQSNGISLVIALIVSVPLLFSPWARETIPFSRVWFIFLIAAGGVAIWPRIFFGVGNFLLRVIGRPPLDVTLTYRQMMLPICLAVGQCLSTGLATWCMVRTISPLNLASVPLMVSISALAGALGLLALFAPAGLGVREGVYLFALSPFIGAEMAALAAICLRLLQIAADILMAVVGILVLQHTPIRSISDEDLYKQNQGNVEIKR